MTTRLNTSSAGSALALDVVPVLDALQNQYEEELNGTKNIPWFEPLARHIPKLLEGLAGLFALVYLFGAIALGAALLFYTFRS